MRTLSDAKDIRARLLKRVQVEQPDAVEEQVLWLSPIIDINIILFKDIKSSKSHYRSNIIF